LEQELAKNVRETNKLREKMIHAQEVQADMLKELEKLSLNKLDNTEFHKFQEGNAARLGDIDIESQRHDNDIKSIENYVEKYVPCNTQNQIIDNLSMFVSKDIIHKLKSQANKVQATLTKNMLADNGKGTIIANGGKPPAGEDPKSTLNMDSEAIKT
jgi:hypothetical protein